MADDLDQIDVFVQGLVEQLSPQSRRRLSRTIATTLRNSQAKRITQQRNPDGSAYEPRKPQKRLKKGRIKRAMFAKIRLSRHLKAKATPDMATVEFTDRTERIARVHQYGLRDRVSRIRNLTVKYAERQLLGFSTEELNVIQGQVIDHLAK